MHSRATYPYPLGVEPIHPPIPTHPPPNLIFVEIRRDTSYHARTFAPGRESYLPPRIDLFALLLTSAMVSPPKKSSHFFFLTTTHPPMTLYASSDGDQTWETLFLLRGLVATTQPPPTCCTKQEQERDTSRRWRAVVLRTSTAQRPWETRQTGGCRREEGKP